MLSAQLRVGSEIANGVRPSSHEFAPAKRTLHTLDDLVRELTECPPSDLPVNHWQKMLTTSSRLADYLGKRIDEVTLVEIRESRSGFRAFLVKRKYRPQTIATYVASVGRLLKRAYEMGWQPSETLPPSWRLAFSKANDKRVQDLILHLGRVRRSPSEVTELDTEQWLTSAIANELPPSVSPRM